MKLPNINVGEVVKSIGSIADDLLTSDKEKENMSIENDNIKETVTSKSWRHWVGRICAISLGLYFIPQYVIAAILWCKMCWNAGIVNGVINLPPYPATAEPLMELIIGVLGLGTIKAVENITKNKK